ncbi:reverse transcriptase domain-containing protein [Confluentibacter lentus]|uniref:reverse transcriptase domain-containing protein n=1 Tax=Confluentibacter lentus TaxID=1699412 RepID=UPI000C2840C2|nr:reverse transcriptase domain-containing protein [Confluentibacter lentus]
MNEEWLKFKKYPHIGIPLTSQKDKSWLKSYISNPENIANHKFVPLMHRTLSQRKYRPLENAPKNDSGKRKRTVSDKKERHIYFSSHLDSIIYSYYSHLLTKTYEEYLEDKPYGSVAVAYRKIPIGNGKSGNKSNIEFAFEAFEFIEKNKHRKLSIIVADVTSFFDNLDHRILHRQWKRILGTTNLPDDHYTIFKNLVDNKYVNENELFKRFQHKLIVERFKPNDTSHKILKRKKVSKIYNMRHENVVAFCDKDEFFEEATDLIRVDKPYKRDVRKKLDKKEKKGIPQGTPISATLANIYMLDFDERIYSEVDSNSKEAYYQRYSDDLIIICAQKDEKHFYNLIQKEIEIEANLEIQPKKTNIYRYELTENSVFKGGIVKDETINSNKQLEYLGFMYDGSKVKVKTAGFSKFYRTMKRSFRRGAHFAKKAHIPSDSLFETRLYKRFTHLGSKRRLKWLQDENSPKGYSPSKHFDWGNFISYLNKANYVMKEINKDDTIIQQYSKVWNKFHKIKKSIYQELNIVK